MTLNLYKFDVSIWFAPPQYGSFEWDGHEEHEEFMFASSAEVAARSIKKVILNKCGQSQARLISLKISDPVLINEQTGEVLNGQVTVTGKTE